MTQEELETLLGRPLTSNEVNNLDTYLDIAKESLEDLLCMPIDLQGDTSDDDEYTQVFDIREGYSTVFTGIFTEITEVKIDSVVTDNYYPAFWDKRSNPYYNSIILDYCSGKEVEVTGVWGFISLPSDIQLLWAQLFANVSKRYVPGTDNVQRKAVEDFSIWLGDLTDDETFLNANQRIIGKYSLCNIGYVLHGQVCVIHGRYDCGTCR